MSKRDDETNETPEAPPRKLLLGKRVLRNFNVRTGVQTGVINGTTTILSVVAQSTTRTTSGNPPGPGSSSGSDG
jgi:hypothetical protein